MNLMEIVQPVSMGARSLGRTPPPLSKALGQSGSGNLRSVGSSAAAIQVRARVFCARVSGPRLMILRVGKLCVGKLQVHPISHMVWGSVGHAASLGVGHMISVINKQLVTGFHW